jgi:hypothetical protein
MAAFKKVLDVYVQLETGEVDRGLSPVRIGLAQEPPLYQV